MANSSRSSTPELTNILWNSKIHCRIQKSSPPDRILSQMNTAHTTPSHFSKIHFNIILPRTSR
jgi:hypothetical protein